MRGEQSRLRPWRRRFKVFFIYMEIGLLLLLAIGLGCIGGAFYSVVKMLPSGADISGYEPTEATKIISSDGVILAEVFEENRELVPIEDIPEDLQNATIAIEDARFYKHPGVDPQGIARSIYQNLRRKRMAQGGSTLTQQLARNIYLTREKKISRKLKEILLALELERNFSKEQILELYMNQVFYGAGAYGVQTASRVYFGKDVKDLSLAESALLAGLTQRPSAISPFEDLPAAIRRRNVVLERMAELGYITSAQRDEAKEEEVKLVKRQPVGISKYKAPWFVTHVIKELTERYGADLVYRRGLRVHTTLNYEMQKVAEEALRAQVSRASKAQNVSQGALVCIDPHTGYIRAMVGSVTEDFTKDQYNRATQARRQPGSAFKAFVYLAAVDSGYDVNYRISNSPITFKGYGPSGWTPRNYDGRTGGTMTMKQAVALSVNICAARMADQVGIDTVIQYARMLGVKSPLARSHSIALGASGVTVLEITSAYGVFAANGLRAEPMTIVRINESNANKDGAIIEQNKPVTRQVLSQQTAASMNELFRAVVTSGTAARSGANSIPHAHGKTGTTNNDRDAWYCGYTPELSTTIWVGNDDYQPMRKVYGGGICAPAWTQFMKKALEVHKKEVREPRPEPARLPRTTTPEPRREAPASGPKRVMLSICRDSGLLATPNCPDTYQAPFDEGDEPTTRCPLHGGSGSRQNTNPPAETVSPAQPRQQPSGDSRPATDSGPGRPGTTSQPVEGYVSVTICVDSGQVATTYCPETVTRRYPRDDAPKGTCPLHRPPDQ